MIERGNEPRAHAGRTLRRAGYLLAALAFVPLSACRKDVAGTAVMEPSRLEELPLPLAVPAGWDPVSYNLRRGNLGAVPESDLPLLNAPWGVREYLGAHLPYVVAPAGGVPAGYLALMWGDPELGYPPHPQSMRGPVNDYGGNWFDWVRVRRATAYDVDEVESRFSEWPKSLDTDRGRFTSLTGGSPQDDGGRNTVYLVALPEGIQSGDLVRIHAHCKQHGEYVDFVRVP